jgi:hypothetical protein
MHPDEGPTILPAGMPPGVATLTEERPPDGVFYFRLYAALMLVVCALFFLFGMFQLVKTASASGSSPPDIEDWIAAGVLMTVGIVGAIPYVIPLFAGRKAWVHTLGTIAIALPMTSMCCLPIAVPVLLVWLKPETRRYFDQNQRAGAG